MTIRERYRIDFRARWRTPDIAEIEKMVGQHGGSSVERDGFPWFHIDCDPLPHEKMRALRAYMAEHGYELLSVKAHTETTTEDDLDLRLFDPPP